MELINLSAQSCLLSSSFSYSRSSNSIFSFLISDLTFSIFSLMASALVSAGSRVANSAFNWASSNFNCAWIESLVISYVFWRYFFSFISPFRYCNSTVRSWSSAEFWTIFVSFVVFFSIRPILSRAFFTAMSEAFLSYSFLTASTSSPDFFAAFTSASLSISFTCNWMLSLWSNSSLELVERASKRFCKLIFSLFWLYV